MAHPLTGCRLLWCQREVIGKIIDVKFPEDGRKPIFIILRQPNKNNICEVDRIDTRYQTSIEISNDDLLRVYEKLEPKPIDLTDRFDLLDI